MTLTIPDDVRAKAEVYVGDAAGQEKTRLLLQETGLPSGLLPLRDIVECGYVEETGFVWLRQRRRVDHYFAGAGRHVSYGAEVSAVAEKGRLRRITGVKAKEMLIWVSLHEICLDDPPAGKLVCKAMGGLSRSFPVEAFEAAAPVVSKPAAVVEAATTNRDGGVVVVPAAAAGEAEEGGAKKQEEVKKPVEEKEQAKRESAAEGDDKSKAKEEDKAIKAKEDSAAAAIDAAEEKLKDMTTTDAVHAEAVAAKN